MNKEKRAEYDRKYREEHKEQIKKQQWKWYDANRDKWMKQKKEYYEKNKTVLSEKGKIYRKLHKEKIKIRNSKRHNKNKIWFDNLKINGCTICGYNKCNSALHFHHVIPEDKKFAVSASNMGYVDFTDELNKCILLCANCHREMHCKDDE